ncbi:MAG TPA: right-handed parallel beta-helix repeat-containing protein [Bradyrhizobium sp.]|nr:right-handed parallel beta-helix repeat-containing protein [Bradyrhizobium sp.]
MSARSRRLSFALSALSLAMVLAPISARAQVWSGSYAFDVSYVYPTGGDDSTVLSNAITLSIAQNECLRLAVDKTGNSVFTVSSLSIPSGACIIGSGRDRTVIRRIANDASARAMVLLPGNSYEIRDLTFDGNKANETFGGNNVGVTGAYYSVHFTNVRSTGAKAAAGSWGTGINFSGAGTDGANGTTSYVVNSKIDNNDSDGCALAQDDVFRLSSNLIASNAGNGCIFNVAGVPSGVTIKRVVVAENHFIGNTKDGLIVGSFNASVGSLGTMPGPNPVGQGFSITGNEVAFNLLEGIAYQGEDASIVGNDIHDNGSGNEAGLLLNASHVVASSNSIYNNAQWGIDAGGCVLCTIRSNQVYNNTQIGIQPGASVSTTVAGNTLWGNPIDINAARYDGGGNGTFPNPTTDLRIADNDITLQTSDEKAITLTSAPQAEVKGNRCHVGTGGGVYGNCYKFETNSASVNLPAQDNKIYTSAGAPIVTIASAATLTLPDGGDKFFISGTTQITSLQTSTMQTYAGKLIAVLVTNGSGGNGSETIGFSGGGCTVEPTATPLIANDGTLRGATITGNGSGCTSAPACAISGGTLSGATCTAIINGINHYQRRVTLLFAGTGGMASGGNQLLNGTFTAGTNGGSLVLEGSSALGKWVEISRAVY